MLKEKQRLDEAVKLFDNRVKEWILPNVETFHHIDSTIITSPIKNYEVLTEIIPIKREGMFDHLEVGGKIETTFEVGQQHIDQKWWSGDYTRQVAALSYSNYPGNCGIAVIYHIELLSSLIDSCWQADYIERRRNPLKNKIPRHSNSSTEFAEMLVQLAIEATRIMGYTHIQYTNNGSIPGYLEEVIKKYFEKTATFVNQRTANLCTTYYKNLVHEPN